MGKDVRNLRIRSFSAVNSKTCWVLTAEGGVHLGHARFKDLRVVGKYSISSRKKTWQGKLLHVYILYICPSLSILTPQKCLFWEPIHPCYTNSNPSIGGSLGILRDQHNKLIIKFPPNKNPRQTTDDDHSQVWLLHGFTIPLKIDATGRRSSPFGQVVTLRGETWKNPGSLVAVFLRKWVGKYVHTLLVGGFKWFQPIWKIWSSNWIISPSRGENKTCLKPPPRWSIYLRTNALFYCNAQGTSPKDYTLKTLVVPNKTGPTGYSEQTYSSKSEIQR